MFIVFHCSIDCFAQFGIGLEPLIGGAAALMLDLDY